MTLESKHLEITSGEFEKFDELVQNSISKTSGKLSKYAYLASEDLHSRKNQHFQNHHQLEKVDSCFLQKNAAFDVLLSATTPLCKSKEILQKASHAARLSGISGLFTPTIPGSCNLLNEIEPNSSFRKVYNDQPFREWELNFGLLYSVYQRTENPEIKTTIRFLMTNYLEKAASLNLHPPLQKIADSTQDEYANMLQLGHVPASEGIYHRIDAPSFDYSRLINEKIIPSPRAISEAIHLVESIEAHKLFNVSFKVAPEISEPEKLIDFLVHEYENKYYPPVLIDLTSQLGEYLITGNNENKIRIYLEKRNEAHKKLNEIFNLAAQKILKERLNSKGILRCIIGMLKDSAEIVVRAKVNDYLSVFASQYDFRKNRLQQSSKIPTWMEITGTSIGRVNLHRHLAELHQDPIDLGQNTGNRVTKYAFEGSPLPAEPIFPTPTSYLISSNFITFKKFAFLEDSLSLSAQVLLAQATVKMINCLLKKISDDRWKSSETFELTQIAIFRLSQHIAHAYLYKNDFRKFSQAIDRAHAELTTLLTLYTPFDPKKFQSEYTEFISSILPESLISTTTVGLGKSAMNIFAGVNSIIIEGNSNPVRACTSHSYYEMVALMGKTDRLDTILADPKVEKIDLYVTEFNHNIVLDPNHTHYKQENVIEDIRKIFREKPHTDQLTVAIDGTIDFVQSEDLANVFLEFEEEILEGRLNIVVFRSGQKFDMLGLDNYFGAPFYIINNGNSKWNAFKSLTQNPVFQTDPISRQFFTWMAESDPAIVDRYKKIIFDNTKAILATVPQQLLPSGKEHRLCVCTFDEQAKTPFIDIKFPLDHPNVLDPLAEWAQNRFYELFKNEGKLVYSRASYGFAHANSMIIEGKWRITPGLDPDEIRLYKQFFNELAAKIDEKDR